jgi:hypothetical protein
VGVHCGVFIGHHDHRLFDNIGGGRDEILGETAVHVDAGARVQLGLLDQRRTQVSGHAAEILASSGHRIEHAPRREGTDVPR